MSIKKVLNVLISHLTFSTFSIMQDNLRRTLPITHYSIQKDRKYTGKINVYILLYR